MITIKHHNNSNYLCFKIRKTIMVSKVAPFIINVCFWLCFELFFHSYFNLLNALDTAQHYLPNVLFNLVIVLFATAICRLALASTTIPPEDFKIILPAYIDIYNHW